jgi:hypothetical protein
MEHNCQFIIGFRMGLYEDGDPILCDKPAPIKQAQGWLCAEHYDEVLSFVKDAVDKAADL